ncbi:MAG: radical SAM protein [Elusimicrobiota bacterium]
MINQPKTFRGRLNRWKTKALITAQDFLLPTLGEAKPGSFWQSLIRNFSQKFIGGYPYVIKLDLTNRCNLKCKMCYAANDGTALSFEKIIEILSQFHNVPIRLDLLGGEPLMRDDLVEVVKFAKAKIRVKQIVLFTNATLMTEKLANNLFLAGVDKALVTFISFDAQKHDAFTDVPASWGQAIEGINHLAKAGIKTHTFTALHRENIGDFEQINKFVQNKLKLHPLFYQYVPQRKNDPLSPDPNDWQKIKNQILSANAEHFRYIKRVLTFYGRICLGGHYSFSIKTNGGVTPCPFIRDPEIGNVFKENFWDIFAQRFAKEKFRKFMSLPEECRKCSIKNFCGGGCRAGNNLTDAGYSRYDDSCPGPSSEPVSINTLPTFF